MSTIVNGDFAAFAAELGREFERILDEHLKRGSDIQHHVPIGLRLITVDGVAAKFYEEGIEFYPEGES